MRLSCLLLVDDDLITTFLNQSLIKKLHLCEEVETASNGLEALKKIRANENITNHCPALIFLDINMAVMDGFEFMRNFNELDIPNKEEITVVVLTTSTNSKDIDNMKKLGVNYFLQKPLKETEILKILENINTNSN